MPVQNIFWMKQSPDTPRHYVKMVLLRYSDTNYGLHILPDPTPSLLPEGQFLP